MTPWDQKGMVMRTLVVMSKDREVQLIDGVKQVIAEVKGEVTAVEPDFDAGQIVVACGFQGIDADFNITTLGRGGSDLTATALAAVLQANECEIYTDVEGVFTSDPRVVPTARKIEQISYDEMLEMASLGAKVLQTRSVEFAAKFNVPVEVNSSFKEGKGTLVTKEDVDMEAVAVAGVTGDRNQAKITIIGVPDKPGVAARIFVHVGTRVNRSRGGA